MKSITKEFGPELMQFLNEGRISHQAMLLHTELQIRAEVSEEWLVQHLDFIGNIMMMETAFATGIDRIIGLENELEELRKKKTPKKSAMRGGKRS